MVIRYRSDGCIGSNLNALFMSTLANNVPGSILMIFCTASSTEIYERLQREEGMLLFTL